MKYLIIKDFTYEYYSAGDPNDELVIFLHGFPETAFMWRNLIRDVSRKGYFCFAPNQRGYSHGARPKGKRNYCLDLLSADVIAFAEAFKKTRFHLVGHDWGAAIGWKVVADNPDRVLSWTALSLPHIQAFFSSIRLDEDQKKKSQYIRNFQWPFIPEIKLKSKDFKLLRRIWKHSEKEEVDNYLSLFKQKRALTAALNYYRCARLLPKESLNNQICGQITTPTLFIWGEKDIAIGAKGVERGHEYIIGSYEFVKLNAGHFLIQTEYDQILKGVLRSLNGLPKLN